MGAREKPNRHGRIYVVVKGRTGYRHRAGRIGSTPVSGSDCRNVTAPVPRVATDLPREDPPRQGDAMRNVLESDCSHADRAAPSAAAGRRAGPAGNTSAILARFQPPVGERPCPRGPAVRVARSGDRVRRRGVPGEPGHHHFARHDLPRPEARLGACRRHQRQRRQSQLRPRHRQQHVEVHHRPRLRHRRFRRVRPRHRIHRLREPEREARAHSPERRREGQGGQGFSKCSTPTSPERGTSETPSSTCASAGTCSTGARAPSSPTASTPSTTST